MPAILFDDDRLVVGKNEYDYSDLVQIRIARAPLLATYGIMELKTRDDRTIPVPFFKADLHRLRTAVEEVTHILAVRSARADRMADVASEHAPASGIPAADPEGEKETAGAQTPAPDPYEEMKKLKELLDLDIITREEFDRKKKELLGL
ncbi:MAG: SHOCT domain-containing protein [Lachnospiraceae bacterium]|nr:SHOCT domain-containing protein [Lachnospiraceae bacterium]